MVKKTIKDLLKNIDIVDIISDFSKIERSGNSYKTICNVHGDKKPSLYINIEKQIFKCFPCDHGGNALEYLKWAQNFSFEEAVIYLANKCGEDYKEYLINLDNEKKYSKKEEEYFLLNEEMKNLFVYYLTNSFDGQINKAKEYLSKRNILDKTINYFNLGYAPNINNKKNYLDFIKTKKYDESLLINASFISQNDLNLPYFIDRIMIPLFNEENKIVAFSSRSINDDNNIRYLLSKDNLVFKKNEILFNLNNVINKNETIILVEGFFDVFKLYNFNYLNVCALIGTNLSESILKKINLNFKKIILFLDNDQAGQKATIKNLKLLLSKTNLKIFIVNYLNSNAKDPDELLTLNPNFKIENNLINGIDYLYSQMINEFDLINDKEKFLKSFGLFLAKENQIKRNEYLKILKNKLSIEDEELLKKMLFNGFNVLKYKNSKDNLNYVDNLDYFYVKKEEGDNKKENDINLIFEKYCFYSKNLLYFLYKNQYLLSNSIELIKNVKLHPFSLDIYKNDLIEHRNDLSKISFETKEYIKEIENNNEQNEFNIIDSQNKLIEQIYYIKKIDVNYQISLIKEKIKNENNNKLIKEKILILTKLVRERNLLDEKIKNFANKGKQNGN